MSPKKRRQQGQDEKSLKGCLKGCDNYAASKHYNEITSKNENETFGLCEHSCEDSFKDENVDDKRIKLEACQQGCGFTTVQKVSPQQSILDFFFGPDLFSGLDGDDSHRHGDLAMSLPRISIGHDFEIPMGQMMHNMNERMNRMMESVRSIMTSSSRRPMESGGRMYVMQSGPGFHEEKTYDIGPSGKLTLIENDMMGKENPLEQNNSEENVEIFEPKSSPKDDAVWNDIDEEFAKIIQRSEDESREEQKLIEPILQELDRQILRDNFDGPRLPETGLRSRGSRDLCHTEPEKLNWSEWVSCLHSKLGVPRWVMTTSICMGIIFLLWLCLVIPNNAPKQRLQVKVIDSQMSAKEAEALGMKQDECQSDKVNQDLPPRYEDVANLSVKLEPVHQRAEDKKPDV